MTWFNRSTQNIHNYFTQFSPYIQSTSRLDEKCIVCGNEDSLILRLRGFKNHGIASCMNCRRCLLDEKHLFEDLNVIFDLSYLEELHDLKLSSDPYFTWTTCKLKREYFNYHDNINHDAIGTTFIHNNVIYIHLLRKDCLDEIITCQVPLKDLLEFNNIDFKKLEIIDKLTDFLGSFDRTYLKFVD